MWSIKNVNEIAEMKVEVLMSAMHQTDFSLGYKSKVDSDLLIVNQCDNEKEEEIWVNGHRWRMISTKERGLSKSRNMALRYAKGDICLLSDDDEEFSDGYAKSIIESYMKYPDASAIVFNVRRINYNMKKKYYRILSERLAPKYRGYQSAMLTFRREVIMDNHIYFDEKFGSGTSWGGGEEILFERDIRRKGLLLYENPFQVATLNYAGGSQWFKGYNERYFYNLGAFGYYASDLKLTMSQIVSMLYVCFYKLRKEKQLSSLKKMYWMCKGMRGIKNNTTYDELIKS